MLPWKKIGNLIKGTWRLIKVRQYLCDFAFRVQIGVHVKHPLFFVKHSTNREHLFFAKHSTKNDLTPSARLTLC